MLNTFELNGFVFELRTRHINKAEKKVKAMDEEFKGLEHNEEVMFLLLKSGQSRDEYDSFLDELNEDDYLNVVLSVNKHYKEVGKKIADYTQEP